MTKDDIIKLSREAGLAVILGEHASEYGNGTFENTPYPELVAFANLVAAHKAEVALAEAYRCGYKDGMEAVAALRFNLQQDRDVRDECAAAIRVRGTT